MAVLDRGVVVVLDRRVVAVTHTHKIAHREILFARARSAQAHVIDRERSAQARVLVQHKIPLELSST